MKFAATIFLTLLLGIPQSMATEASIKNVEFVVQLPQGELLAVWDLSLLSPDGDPIGWNAADPKGCIGSRAACQEVILDVRSFDCGKAVFGFGFVMPLDSNYSDTPHYFIYDARAKSVIYTDQTDARNLLKAADYVPKNLTGGVTLRKLSSNEGLQVVPLPHQNH